MDSDTLAPRYFDVILLDGSGTAAPKGMMSCRNCPFRQLKVVMDSGTLALLYFDVILLDGSRAAAPKGTMSCKTHMERF